MKAKLIGINARFTHSCLALFYVRHQLRSSCPSIEFELHQFTINDPYYELVLRIGEGRPDYLFFSTLIWNSDLTQCLISDLLNNLPDVQCIVGGPQAEIVVNNVGNSRCTLVSGNIESIEQSFFTDLENGTLGKRYNSTSGQLDRANFPFPYEPDDFQTHLKNRHIYYESSRGCPFSCSYCLSSTSGRVFHKPLEQVFAELDQILAHQVKVLRFVDRTFNDRADRALAIWQYLAKKEVETLFHFEVAPDRFTPEVLDFLATVAPGKFQFEAGIQSTNQETLQAINRRMDVQKAGETIRRLAGPENIHLHVDLILGLPQETKETFLNSFNQVFSMRPHHIQMGLLKILPDTRICHAADDLSYTHSSSPPYSVFSNKWLDNATMAELYWFSECVEKFYNNRYFLSLWSYLRDRHESVALFFTRLVELCHKRGFFQLAATHELMGELLLKLYEDSPEEKAVRELLTYDWLRCGHRFLPVFLSGMAGKRDDKQLLAIKKELYVTMPEEIAPLYTATEKSSFFKKALFYSFSTPVLKTLGFMVQDGSSSLICFTQQRQLHVHRLCETVLIDNSASKGKSH